MMLKKIELIISEKNRKEQLINAFLLKNAPIFYEFINDNIAQFPEDLMNEYSFVENAIKEINAIINS